MLRILNKSARPKYIYSHICYDNKVYSTFQESTARQISVCQWKAEMGTYVCANQMKIPEKQEVSVSGTEEKAQEKIRFTMYPE